MHFDAHDEDPAMYDEDRWGRPTCRDETTPVDMEPKVATQLWEQYERDQVTVG